MVSQRVGSVLGVFIRALAYVRRRIGLWHNVWRLPQAAAENSSQDESVSPQPSSVNGDDGGLRQPLVGGSASHSSSFSMDGIMARFELVKSGEMSSDEFLSVYPENMVGVIGASVVVDKSLLRSA